MLLHCIRAGADDERVVPHDLHLVAFGQEGSEFINALRDGIDDGDGVLSRLLPQRERDGGHAIESGHALQFLRAVLDTGDIAQSHETSTSLANDEALDVLKVLGLANDAEACLMRGVLHHAGRDLHVLHHQRTLHIERGEIEGLEADGVEPDIDLPLLPAEQSHLPDTGHAFQTTTQDLVGILSDVARRLVCDERDAEDGRSIGVELLDDGRVHVIRQRGDDAVHAVAHFLCGDIDVLFQKEDHEDLRDAVAGDRAELVDAADGVHRFFDAVGDLRFDLLRCGADESRGDGHRGEVHFRKAVHRKAGVTQHTYDDEH